MFLYITIIRSSSFLCFIIVYVGDTFKLLLSLFVRIKTEMYIHWVILYIIRCNKQNGHIVTWKNRQEFMWIHNNVAKIKLRWYWVGVFCGNGVDLKAAYLVTGLEVFIKVDAQVLVLIFSIMMIVILSSRTSLCDPMAIYVGPN